MYGIAAEATWLATHVVFYPVGVVSRRLTEPWDVYTLAGLSPLRRSLLVGDVEAAGTPILLLHGLVDNRSIFMRLHRSLNRRGFGRVVSLNLQLYATDVGTAATRLAAEVEALCEQTSYSRIHIVAHSLGGLVARYYIQKMGGDTRVHTLVTLGTPHRGTWLARLLPRIIPYRLVSDLRPDSPLLQELAEPAPGCSTRFVAFAGDLDTLVRPPRNALLSHPDLQIQNVMMRGLGHHALPFDSRVVHRVANLLARLDPAGDIHGRQLREDPIDTPGEPECASSSADETPHGSAPGPSASGPSASGPSASGPSRRERPGTRRPPARPTAPAAICAGAGDPRGPRPFPAAATTDAASTVRRRSAPTLTTRTDSGPSRPDSQPQARHPEPA
jgi:pimeloyl-ACP methyl ester carboxylesterase